MGGAIAPSALVYTTPLTLNRATFIRSRVKDGANWSALVETVIYVQQDFTKLFVSEVMYNPPAVGLVSGDEFEFLELKNTGVKTLDLSGLFFSDAVTFSFTNGTSLAPGQFFVLARNAAQFQSKYPGIAVDGVSHHDARQMAARAGNRHRTRRSGPRRR